MTLGQRIRRVRQELGLTQAELGGTTYSKSFISQLERDLVRPSLPTLIVLAQRLGRSVQELLDGAPSVEAVREADAWARALLALGREHAAWERLAPLLEQGPPQPAGVAAGAAWAALYGTAGLIHWRRGQRDEAIGLLERGLAIARGGGRAPAAAALLVRLGDVHASRPEGNPAAARCWREAWELEAAYGRPFPPLIALPILLRLAELDDMQGDAPAADRWRAEAAGRLAQLEGRGQPALALLREAVLLHEHDPVTARDLLATGLAGLELTEVRRLADAIQTADSTA